MSGQRGFILLELLIGVLILTLLAVWGATTLVRRLDETAAQASAVWMLSARAATQAYIQRYGTVLIQENASVAMASHGYADWAAPRLEELKADGLLSAGFPTRNNQVGGVAVEILRQGNCPGPECRLAAVISGTQPLLQRGSGQVNKYMIAQWLMASQGWGGRVSSTQPHAIMGTSFHYPNPPVAGKAALPPGTVALAITSEQTANADFLRVGDSRNPDFQGELAVQGDVSASSALRVGGNLRLDNTKTLMARCNDPYVLARSNTHGLLMCIDGVWQSASRSGGGYSIDSKLGCRKGQNDLGVNPFTKDCSCLPTERAVMISDSGPPTPGGSRLMGFLCVADVSN